MIQKVMLSLAVLAAAGCATTPLPAYRLEESQASIRAAEEVGALNVPAARLHLQLAKDETLLGQQMAGRGDTRAALLMARAEADAELALGLAHEAAVHGDALKAADDLKVIRARATP